MHTAIKALAKAIVPDAILGPLMKRRFLSTRTWANRHWGVFESFDAASQFMAVHGAPAHFSLDHRKWLEERFPLMAHDYPVMFWLGRILDGHAARVVDLGGSVGVSYYAFQQVMEFPQGLRWEVCELQEAVEVGRQIAQEKGAGSLSFTTDLKSIDGADILFTAGAIQYIEEPLPRLLRDMQVPPRHVLINRVPLTNRRSSFVTLQHSGITAQPYWIANYHEFVKAMGDLGYRQRDHWKCLENYTDIPLHPDLSLQYFHGFYFDRNAT